MIKIIIGAPFKNDDDERWMMVTMGVDWFGVKSEHTQLIDCRWLFIDLLSMMMMKKKILIWAQAQ